MKKILQAFSLGLILLSLAACNATQPGKTAVDKVAEAEQAGNLETFYQQLAKKLESTAWRLTHPGAKSDLVRAGGILAKKYLEAAHKQLESERLETGIVPLSVIEKLIHEKPVLQKWNAEQYDAWQLALKQEEAVTRAAIAVEEKKLAAMALTAVKARYESLGKLLLLVGENHARSAGLEKKRFDLLNGLLEQANRLLQSGEIAKTRELVSDIREIEADFPGADELLAKIRARELINKLQTVWDQGNIDETYDLFVSIYNDHPDESIRQDIEKIGRDLFDYLVSSAATDTNDDDYFRAYKSFKKARVLTDLLHLAKSKSQNEELDFADKLIGLVEDELEAGRSGRALGLLAIIEELQPGYDGLAALRQLSWKRVLDKSSRKVSTGVFGSPESDPNIGMTVGMKVAHHLMQLASDDIRIVEREQLGAVLREQEIQSIKTGSTVNLLSADYLIEGSITQARVDSTEQKGRKTVRTVTGKKSVENPEYQRWLKLSPEKKRTSPEPPRFVQQDVLEDISINVTLYKKAGIVSAIFRVIDPVTGRVILADTVKAKKTFQDESSEGVQVGTFSSPFKIADLPSDSEIIDQLGEEVSHEIAKRLLVLLGNPEEAYELDAKRFAGNGSYIQAVESCASAYVMHTEKAHKEKADSLLELLREYAIASTLAL